jgi:hypothetical protein
MPLVSFDYRFSVGLPAGADEAYRWATDYQPDDLARMGQSGQRRVEWLTASAALVIDSVRTDRGTVTKTRLVRLRPRQRSWSNTHLAGPNRYSQFFYTIRPRGPHRSTLEFVGLQVEHAPRRLSASELSRRARAVARGDAATWKRLVRAMEMELGGPRPRTREGRSRSLAWAPPQGRPRSR